MKFLINNKEYSEVLAVRALQKELQKISLVVHEPQWKKTHKAQSIIQQMVNPTVPFDINLAPAKQKDRDILQSYISDAVIGDLTKWLTNYGVDELKLRKLLKYINAQFYRFTDEEKQKIHELYIRSTRQTLTRKLARGWKDTEFISRDSVDILTPDPLFIRNIVNNEEIIKTRSRHNLPYWFMDTGYTNFLEPNKKWHRLCRNDIHLGTSFNIRDRTRLDIFPVVPAAWRKNGQDIIIIEPSPTQCFLFDIDPKRWTKNVVDVISPLIDSNKRIVIREKNNKKERNNFYEELLDTDAYCVIHFNSNASVESIWAGVPVITLGRHITRPISTVNLKHINELARPPIKQWLQWLSYNQFTIDEIANGTAKHILETKIYRD